MLSPDQKPERIPLWVCAVIIVASPFVGVGIANVLRVFMP